MHYEISVVAFGGWNLKLWSANDGVDCTFYPANYFTCRYAVNAKSKIILLRAWRGPLGLQEVETRRLSRQSVHKSAKFASHTRRQPLTPHPQVLLILFLSVTESTPGLQCSFGRNMSMRNSNNSFGNQTRDLLACSAVVVTWRAGIPQNALSLLTSQYFLLRILHAESLEASTSVFVMIL